jgi:hypothetical protein
MFSNFFLLNDLYSSPNIIQVFQIEKNEMGGAYSTYGERRGVYRVLVGKQRKETTWKTLT